MSMRRWNPRLTSNKVLDKFISQAGHKGAEGLGYEPLTCELNDINFPT